MKVQPTTAEEYRLDAQDELQLEFARMKMAAADVIDDSSSLRRRVWRATELDAVDSITMMIYDLSSLRRHLERLEDSLQHAETFIHAWDRRARAEVLS